MVSDSHGRGNFLSYDTASTTIEIPEGRIVELDSSGDVILPTTTPGNPIGVSATNVDARTTATVEKITVQTAGICSITCAANQAFGYNDQILAVTLTGYGATAATFAGTTFGSEDARKVVGRVFTPDATTTGTTVVAILNIK